MGYNIVSLKKICNSIGETKAKELVADFECNLNKDVELFLREKAIEFFKQGIAETFIVTSSYKDKQVIVGYFSIAHKITKIRRNVLSGNTKRRLLRFAEYDTLNKCYIISLPLIGQLGKNYKNNYDKLITGDILLKLAFDTIKVAQDIFGGKFVFLECEDTPKLKDFYESNGFVCFGKRNLDKDERETNSGQYLLQMLRDLSNYE